MGRKRWENKKKKLIITACFLLNAPVADSESESTVSGAVIWFD